MIQVVLETTKEGELVSCNAEGHAFFSEKGSDIVCSAVTILLRTTLGVLEANQNVEIKAEALKRGTLSFRIEKKEKDDGQYCESSLLKYARVFLENGLTSLCKEYPEHVSLHIEKDFD